VSDVAAATATAQPTAQPAASGLPLWSHGSFSFKDLLDIVNPLQHLPVIGSIYRYLSGDEPSGGARIIGDSLYGGPIGFGVSVVSTALFTDSSGDLGEHALTAMFGPRNDSPTPGKPVVAAAALVTPIAAAVPTAPGEVSAPTQPVAMNQLFRSPPPSAPATPEQAFLAQNAQFQRQISNGRGANGAVINDRPVPLQLSSNLLPVLPPGAHLVTPTPAPTVSQAAAPAPAAVAPAATPAAANANPIAQKMLDALDKYEQMKRQEEQEDSIGSGGSSRVDLAL
jgi:hypothetical protein